MAEKRLGRSTFNRRKPEDIYVKASERHNPHVADTAPNELIFTPDILIDHEPDSVTFSVRCSPVPFGRSPGIQSAISSPRNFFLEKPPPEYYRTEESPISPGVTVLLSPTSYDEDGSDFDGMNFFRAYVIYLLPPRIETKPVGIVPHIKAPKRYRSLRKRLTFHLSQPMLRKEPQRLPCRHRSLHKHGHAWQNQTLTLSLLQKIVATLLTLSADLPWNLANLRKHQNLHFNVAHQYMTIFRPKRKLHRPC
jgi:hypothetical protein